MKEVDLKRVEFITPDQFKARFKDAFRNTGGDPVLDYGEILETIENSIYSVLPNNELFLKCKKYFDENTVYIMKLPKEYKYRPDLISYVFYGSIEYFHLILIANNMKSFLEFNPEKYHTIYVFKESVLPYILKN